MAAIHPTAVVDPAADVAADAAIGAYCTVEAGAVLGARTRLHAHAHVTGDTALGEDCEVFPFASVGGKPQDLKYRGGPSRTVIGDGTTIREYATVHASTDPGAPTRVGQRCLLMAYSHVAHDCALGDEVIVANGSHLAGHIVVEDGAIVGGVCGVHQFVRIGALSIVGAVSKITQDVPPYMTVDGNPAFVRGINRVGLARRGVPEETRRTLKRAFRILCREGLSTSQALECLEAELGASAEVRHLIRFIRDSKRGIIK
jgi:UDP-N-acetylglucosamine acyltransferase